MASCSSTSPSGCRPTPHCSRRSAGFAPKRRGIPERSIRCGKGTYVRVLAEDIGLALGCGAHLAALRRLETGGLRLSASCTLETLAGLSDDECDARLLPPDTLVAALRRIDLEPVEALRFAQGQAVARTGLPDATYRVYTAEGFAGIAVAIEGNVRPRRLTAGAASKGTRAAIESLE